jgi:hypothetical protein
MSPDKDKDVNEPASALKMKLRSKAYIRTVSRMTKKLDTKTKDMKLDETSARINLDTIVGKIGDESVKTSIELEYFANAKEKAEKTSKDLGVSKGNTFAAIYFAVMIMKLLV